MSKFRPIVSISVRSRRLFCTGHCHLGAGFLSIVRSLEVVHISEVKICISSMVKSFGGMWFVRCMEAVRISESPLWEVPLNAHYCASS